MLRVRFRYEKRGPMRFVSHRDLMRIFRRSFAAAEIPVSFSQGFNPHPRFSFGPSLRTGWEGLDEYLDVLLDSPAEDLSGRCNRFLPEGLRVLETGAIGPTVPKLAADITGARYEIFLDGTDVSERRPDLEQPLLDGSSDETREGRSPGLSWVLGHLETAIRDRFSSAEAPRSTPEHAGPPAPVVLEVRCAVLEDTPDGSISIEYLSTMHGGRSLFPEDVLTPFLGDPSCYRVPVRVARKSLYVERSGKFVSPISRAALETQA